MSMYQQLIDEIREPIQLKELRINLLKEIANFVYSILF